MSHIAGLLDSEETTENIFLEADRILLNRHPKEKQPPKVISMPTIDSSKTIQGPIKGVSEAYKKDFEQNKIQNEKQERYEQEQKIIQQLSKISNLESKLPTLDKKKDRARIVELNFKIERAYEKLNDLQIETGIDLSTINEGSRLERFWIRVKRYFKKLKKNIQTFYKDNKKFIKKLLWVIIPGIIISCFKKWLNS